MLIRDTKGIYKHQVRNAVGENATVNDVLDYLFGTCGNFPESDFVIREWSRSSRTKLQRLNMFWAYPLTVLCAPYQYIVRGKTGWNTENVFGRWLLKVTGYLKEV